MNKILRNIMGNKPAIKKCIGKNSPVYDLSCDRCGAVRKNLYRFDNEVLCTRCARDAELAERRQAENDPTQWALNITGMRQTK